MAVHQPKQMVEITMGTIIKAVLVILGVWFAFFARDVLMIIFLAFVLNEAFDPAVRWFERKLGFPRWLGIVALYVLIVSGLILVIGLVEAPIAEQLKSLSGLLPEYTRRLSQFLSQRIGVGQNLTSALDGIKSSSGLLFSNVWNIGVGVVVGIAGAVTTLVLTFYMLLEGKNFQRSLISFVPPKHRDLTERIVEQVGIKMGLWLRGQAALSGSIFVLSLIGLLVFRVNFALTLAVVSGAAEVIPLAGPWIGASAATAVALADSPTKALLVLAYFILIQQLEGHILVPQIMKRALGLSPVVVLVSVLIGGQLLGLIGILLAAPVAAGIVVVIDELGSVGSKT